MMVVSDAHELVDSKATAKNPFSLKVHEIIFRFLVLGPSSGALERLECSETIL